MTLSPGSGLSGAAVAATVALCVIATGCGRSLPGATSGQAIADGGGYLLTADSAALETGITFKALGDSALRIARADATTSVIAAPADTIAGAFGYKSDQPMVDILFRLEQTHHTPRGGITLNPLEIYIWPLPAETTSPLLEARIANGYITPVESRRYSWPVVNDEPQWSLAALEVALAGGSQQYCRRITPVVDNLTKTAATMMQNHATGLYESLPRHFAGQNAGMPSWATPTDLFQTMTLCHNVAWYGVAQARQAVDSTLTRRHKRQTNNTATVPDSLGRIIKTRFWMPNRGQLSAMLYGSPETPLQLAATDNAAQALAIITGLAPKPMAQAIVKRTPVTRTGVTETYPLLTPAPQGSATGNMLLQTLWAVACCRSDNPAAADMAIAGLLLQRLRHLASTSDVTPTISRPVTTIIARCLAGISFHPDGIAFNPYVPHSMPGKKLITGLVYRNATLDIEINGTGSTVAAFAIDGRPCGQFLSNRLNGRHKISITLGVAPDAPQPDGGSVQLIDGEIPVAPAAPAVVWPDSRHAIINPAADNRPPTTAQPQATAYMVCLDAVPEEEIYRHDYTLYEAPRLTTVQFVPVDADGNSGFSGQPHRYLPPRQNLGIEATSLARGGTRIISDKKASKRFVESNRYKNRRIAFEVEASCAGTALVDVRYLNGLGIVNPQRRTAVRRLRANGTDCGTFIFPQLSAAHWNRGLGHDWQLLTGYCNTLPVTLAKGTNRLEIIYWQPSPVYIDPKSNTLLIEQIRLMPLDGHQQLTFISQKNNKTK